MASSDVVARPLRLRRYPALLSAPGSPWRASSSPHCPNARRGGCRPLLPGPHNAWPRVRESPCNQRARYPAHCTWPTPTPARAAMRGPAAINGPTWYRQSANAHQPSQGPAHDRTRSGACNSACGALVPSCGRSPWRLPFPGRVRKYPCSEIQPPSRRRRPAPRWSSWVNTQHRYLSATLHSPPVDRNH